MRGGPVQEQNSSACDIFVIGGQHGSEEPAATSSVYLGPLEKETAVPVRTVTAVRTLPESR